MPNQIYNEITAFFHQLEVDYQRENQVYHVDWSVAERLQNNTLNVKADFQYIYERIALFNPLEKGLSQAISAYIQDNSLFKSKKRLTHSFNL